jgi:hypothetical protein
MYTNLWYLYTCLNGKANDGNYIYVILVSDSFALS